MMQMTAPHDTLGLNHLFSWSAIFTKTPKGREEIVQRRAGLSTKQRSVLIMLDGIKRLDKLMSPIPKEELGSIVDYLAKQDLITISTQPPPGKMLKTTLPTRPIQTQPTAATTIDPNTSAKAHDGTAISITATPIAPDLLITDTSAFALKTTLKDEKKLREIKDFMTTSAHTYLGLLSADLIRRIEHTKDATQLMSTLGLWFIALRDSKHGHRFAASYMAQILAALRDEEHTAFAF